MTRETKGVIMRSLSDGMQGVGKREESVGGDEERDSGKSEVVQILLSSEG